MIEEAVGLFALAPAAFVAERNRLAKALKASGRTDEAAIVAALKRPKLGEYALNRLAHEHGPIIERLVDAIEEAATAQAAAIGGDASDLRDATTELRAATKSAVDSAVQLLNGDGANGEGQRDEIVGLIRSFVGSGDTATLRAGIVGAAAVEGAEDFFRGAPDPPDRPRSPKTAPDAAKPATDRTTSTATKPARASSMPAPAGPSPADRARKIRLERELRDAQGQVERAQRSVAEAEDQLATAQRKVDERTAVLDERQAVVDAAERALAAYRAQWPTG